ncbi:hypothetical protein CHARACLAT_029448, partial [Characodon lateralis]|nr:hypothetical protein [Characodon lateralis]
ELLFYMGKRCLDGLFLLINKIIIWKMPVLKASLGSWLELCCCLTRDFLKMGRTYQAYQNNLASLFKLQHLLLLPAFHTLYLSAFLTSAAASFFSVVLSLPTHHPLLTS